MAEAILTAAAACDLDDIFDYGAEHWGVEQAAGYVAGFADKFTLLADFPSIGSARPDIDEDIRSTPHGSHIIYFSGNQQRVVIARVLHKRRVPHGHV